MTEYQHKIMEEMLEQCAPSSQNNERAYWRKKIEKYFETKNPAIGEDIAERFNLSPDFKNGYDYGNEPEPIKED